MKKITFTLPAEALGTATEALLLGDFNEWDLDKAIRLIAQPDGSLAVSVDLEPGKSYEYRYYLNNGTWVNDWAAERYVFNEEFGIENSLVIVPEEVVIVVEKKATKAPATKAATPKVAAPEVAAPEATPAAPKVKEKKVAPAKKAPEATVVKKEKAAPATPAVPAVPAKDDLTKIEGIGPKIAKLLEAEEIKTFKDLGKATGKKLKAILEAAGPKFQIHDPASWPKQAKLADAGKWDELAALQDTLIGGK